MGFFQKIKEFFKDYAEQCSNCPHSASCLCARCDCLDCKGGALCAKEKPITYCQCRSCEGGSCQNCTPEIY